MNVALLEELLGLLKTLNETTGVPGGESLKEKNVLQNSNADPNKRTRPTLDSNERKRTTEIATLFAKTFSEYKKKTTPDKALATSVQKITPRQLSRPVPAPPSNKPGSLLFGVLALLGGAGALLLGLLTDGPFKGALKILSKIGIKGGLKILLGGAKAFVSTLSKFITAPFKMVGKLFSKGFFSKMFGVFKPLLKVLRKLPLIGSIISIGFAISRFKSKDNIGGIIDVMSALAGLLYLVPGGAFVAFPLVLGLDILNAWLDAKTAGAENKQEAKKDILKDMMKGIGNWFKENALYLPIIGGFKRWGMAIDEFKSGNIMEGIKQLGLGLLTFGGGGIIIKGFEMLMGFFESKDEGKGDLNADKSWYSKFKDWIKSKLSNLPYVLRKPLEWFGILGKSEDDKSDSNLATGAESGFDNVKSFAFGIWDNIKKGASMIKDWVGDSFSKIWENLTESFDSILPTIKGFAEKIKDYIIKFLGNIKNFVKNLWPFGKKDKELTSKQQETLKKSGWSTWEEYEKAGWKYKGSPKQQENLKKSGYTMTPDIVAAESSTSIATAESSTSKANNYILKIEARKMIYLENINNITIEILKQLKGGVGGGNVINMSAPSSSMNNSPVDNTTPLNINRGRYGSSPYALA